MTHRVLAARLLVSVLALSIAQAAMALESVAGSRDPLGLARYPHSEIVSYELDERYRLRSYALGRVEKSQRDLRVQHEVRLSATREWSTYEMPSGTLVADVVQHYLALLGDDIQFSCSGRDCGRSNLWANSVFKQALLYGPDKNQFYLAGNYHDHLVALYVIERGNKRVYAHLEVLKPEQPEQPVAMDTNEAVAKSLSGSGFVVVEGLVPQQDGEMPENAALLLGALGKSLENFAGQDIYVVCHLSGQEPVELLLQRASKCAVAAVALLAADAGPGANFEPFAAGPLLVRPGAGKSRIELVLPHDQGVE